MTCSASVHLPLALALVGIACAAVPATTSHEKGDATARRQRHESVDDAGSDAPSGSAPAQIALGKIHEAPVADFVVTGDALFVISGATVERAALDGTAPASLTTLAGATVLASDGSRLYGLVGSPPVSTLISTKLDGTDLQTGLKWDATDGSPRTLTTNGGRVFLGVSATDRANSAIVSAPAAFGTEDAWRLDEYADSWFVPPAFSGTMMFMLDYYRQSAVRVMLPDSTDRVDVIQGGIPTLSGGIATDGASLYTRMLAGVVKTATGSDGSVLPTVVVPSEACSIVDPADGAESFLEDDLVVDGGLIYTACRNGANVEIRAYDAAGALTKTIAATPYTGRVSHLRVTSNAVYWLAQTGVDATVDALWRAGK